MLPAFDVVRFDDTRPPWRTPERTTRRTTRRCSKARRPPARRSGTGNVSANPSLRRKSSASGRHDVGRVRRGTGDRSGDWLYGTLHAFGFATQPESKNRDDGLKLRDCYITAAVRCAPPANKPAAIEFERCRPYLARELKLFPQCRVVVVLGKIAFDSFLKAYQANDGTIPKPRPQFRHGGVTQLNKGMMLLGSYHPSQQNTFTGRLTREMFHDVFGRARELLGRS